VRHHLATSLRVRGVGAEVVSLGQLSWHAGRARLPDGPIDAIVRFFQAEWLARLPHRLGWRALFVDGHTPVVNPGVAALSESKRLPLVWDALRTPLSTWRRILPETRDVRDAPWDRDDGWLVKSAYCNTGDAVLTRDALSAAGWARLRWTVRLAPSSWLAQRRFTMVPLVADGEPIHPCVGVYVVDGTAAGAYVRLGRGPIVDWRARDAALLLYDQA
jgi:hypothetical protein